MNAQSHADDEQPEVGEEKGPGANGVSGKPLEAKKPIVLTEEERLRASLLQERANGFMLKKQLVVAKSQDLQRENASIDEGLKKVQQEINDFKSTLSCKYQVDFRKEHIEPETGRIVPVNPPA